MRSVSSDYAAAIESSSREIKAEVAVDWNANGTYTTPGMEALSLTGEPGGVESLTIDRSYATALPQEVTFVEGYGIAETNIDISGAPAKALSPYNTSSPIAGVTRLGKRLLVKLGVNDFSPLTAFTGIVRSISSKSKSNSVALEALDLAEEFRAKATIPFVYGMADVPNAPTSRYAAWLNAKYFIDLLLRQNGIHVSPPPTSDILSDAFLPLHGSLHNGMWKFGSSVGNKQEGSNLVAAEAVPENTSPYFVPGKYSLAFRHPASYTTAKLVARYKTPNIDAMPIRSDGFNNRVTVSFIAGPPVTAYPASRILFHFTHGLTPQDPVAGTSALAEFNIGLNANYSVFVSARRANTSAPNAITSGTTAAPADQTARWREYTVQTDFASTSFTTTVWIDGVQQTPITVALGSGGATSQQTFGHMDIRGPVHAPIQCVEVYGHLNNSSFVRPINFVPQAVVDTSKLWMTVTPDIDPKSSAWDIITQIAAAEFATVEFDEDGKFIYRNIDRWAQSTAAVAEINPDRDLFDLGFEENLDQIRNVVSASVQTVRVNSSPTADIWRGEDGYTDEDFVFLSGAVDAELIINTRGRPIGVPSAVGFALHKQPGQDVPDINSPTYPSMTFRVFVNEISGNRILVRYSNPYAFDLYPTKSSYIRGPIAVNDKRLPVTVISQDSSSIAMYNERPYEIPESIWRQQPGSIKTVTDALLADLVSPLPIIENVPVVGDHRRQLGDRVTIKEQDWLGVSKDYWIIGVRSRVAPGSFTQELTLRPTRN